MSIKDHPKAGKDLTGLLTPTEAVKKSQPNVKPVFLGVGMDSAWYVVLPLHLRAEVKEKLGLAGGEDILASAVAGDAGYLLQQAGKRAIPYLDKAIEAKVENIDRLILAMDRSPDKEVTAWLMKLEAGKDEAISAAARAALIAGPRKEAAELYAKWLATAVEKGQSPVDLLAACLAANPKLAADSAKKVLAKPDSFRAYAAAFDVVRAAEGKEFPKELIEAAGILTQGGDEQSHQKAMETIASAKDTQAAAIVAMRLALGFGKGYTGAKPGLKLLAVVPEGKALLKLIIESGRNSTQKERLEEMSKKLEAGGEADDTPRKPTRRPRPARPTPEPVPVEMPE